MAYDAKSTFTVPHSLFCDLNLVLQSLNLFRNYLKKGKQTCKPYRAVFSSI